MQAADTQLWAAHSLSPSLSVFRSRIIISVAKLGHHYDDDDDDDDDKQDEPRVERVCCCCFYATSAAAETAVETLATAVAHLLSICVLVAYLPGPIALYSRHI